MRGRIVRLLAVVVLATLFGGSAALGAPAASTESIPPTTGRVTVSVTVGLVLESTFTADGVVVRSNVPWVVSAQSSDGERIAITGGPTAGQHVALPDAAGPIEVCAR